MEESLRILILEDKPIDAELVQFELREAGFVFTSRVVMTEEDFVRELLEFSPDLILSDYDLPRYNGVLALAEAKRRCPDTPFILVSGAVSEERAIEILTHGAKDYVLKDRLQQRLVPAVRRALAEAEGFRARKQAEARLREAHRTLEERVKVRTAELEAEIAVRKKTEEALLESQMRQADIIEFLPDATFVINREKEIIAWNRAMEEMTGVKKEEMIGKGDYAYTLPFYGTRRPQLLDLLDMDDEELAARYGSLKKVGDTLYAEVFTPALYNGKGAYVFAAAGPLFDVNGKRIGAIESIRDISDRKEIEDKYRNIFDNAIVGISQSTPDGRYIAANPSYARMFG
ncbi:MAG: PAS domain S-box protein, partial [Syntrophales bacterium]|nr:PAS domain S-box protein [Syntrophales bacterium]